MIFNLNPEEHAEAIRSLEERIGYRFSDESLLLTALTHPSFGAEHKTADNQRLEFLGDAILELIVSQFLYQQKPQEQEGVLTRLRSRLVDEKANTTYAHQLQLENLLLLGHGACTTGTRELPSTLGDLFEAFLGALYLDQEKKAHGAGLALCEKIILPLLPDLQSLQQTQEGTDNPKGNFMVFCQAHQMGTPYYRILEQTGPGHAMSFRVAAFLADGTLLAQGTGHSRKQAEANAAKTALALLQEQQQSVEELPTIIALDFDGVICNSARELCDSAWKVARKFWPDLFASTEPPEEIVKRYQVVRPALETGWESIPMLKMLQEGMAPSDFFIDFPAKIQRILQENHLSAEELKQEFSAARDEAIAENLPRWLSLHSFYPGVIDGLKKTMADATQKVVIITTKQERFTLALLQNQGIDFPPENLFGLEKKLKKSEILLQLSQEYPCIEFTEDRLPTLLSCLNLPELNRLKLRYAAWGYGTAADLHKALENPRIKVLHQSEELFP